MNNTQTSLLTPSPVALPPVTYKGQPVVTTEMLAHAYGCSAKSIRQNFNNNRERFIEGKHFYSLQNGELQSFRDCVENFDAVVPARTRSLTLWLERGAARHAKMLNTDKAWDVFEMLEETFFRVVKPEAQAPALDCPITPDQQKTLQDIVKAKVDSIPEADKHGGLYPQIWARFKNHFHIPRYTELPQSRMSEAVAYLMGMEMRQKALLPAPKTLSESIRPLTDELSRMLNGAREKACEVHQAIYRGFGGIDLYPERHKSGQHSIVIYTNETMRETFNAIEGQIYALNRHVDLIEAAVRQYRASRT